MVIFYSVCAVICLCSVPIIIFGLKTMIKHHRSFDENYADKK